MRISDWSSDVCSSDLRRWAPWLAFLLIIACWEAASDTGLLPALFMPAPHEVLSALYLLLASGPLFVHIADRKSVVSGKSVSVRVDLGGRRIIKKTPLQIANTLETETNILNKPS